MRVYRPLLIAMLALCISVGAYGKGIASPDHAVNVSLGRLIAERDEHDGKTILVSGFAFIEFENNNLCVVPEPKSPGDCIWISFFDGPLETDADFRRYQKAKKEWARFNRKHVSLRGIFDASDSGHLGGSSGGIGHITEVSLMSANHQK